jgi:LysW-gamma-L-lysine carboxypeptidase
MVMAAAEIAKTPNFKGRVLVASVVEEEAQSRGIRHLIQEGIEADYAIFGEPSGVGNITIGFKGQIQLKITVKTDTGHSSTPWLYDNALDKAYELWKQIKDSYPPVEEQESPFYATSACLTKISGGMANSVIPFESEMFIDIRVPLPYTTKQVLESTIKVVESFKRSNPKVKVKATLEDSVEPFEVHKRSPLVHTMSSSIRKVLNKPATLLRKTGTGDMNILGYTMNIPIVTYGPGDSHLDHRTDEHIIIDDYLSGIQILKETILKLDELYQNKKIRDELAKDAQ